MFMKTNTNFIDLVLVTCPMHSSMWWTADIMFSLSLVGVDLRLLHISLSSFEQHLVGWTRSANIPFSLLLISYSWQLFLLRVRWGWRRTQVRVNMHFPGFVVCLKHHDWQLKWTRRGAVDKNSIRGCCCTDWSRRRQQSHPDSLSIYVNVVI